MPLKDYITYLGLRENVQRKHPQEIYGKNYIKKEIKIYISFRRVNLCHRMRLFFPLFEQMARDRWRCYDFNPQKKYLPPIKSYET